MAALVKYVGNADASNTMSVYANMLETFARQHGFSVHDVPGYGDCLFSSVAYQLQNVGYAVRPLLGKWWPLTCQFMLSFTVHLYISH